MPNFDFRSHRHFIYKLLSYDLWNQTYRTDNPDSKYEKAYDTKSGEFVRSKSEIIIADDIYDANLKDKYEAGILLRTNLRDKNMRIFRPDFNIYDEKNREDTIRRIFDDFGYVCPIKTGIIAMFMKYNSMKKRIRNNKNKCYNNY